MDNILLVFLNDLERVDEFNEIIDEFDKNGYSMYLLDNIKEDEYFSIDILPTMVETYKNQHKNANKVVVLSNSRDLIFSWFRCYNSLVDDFVYFIDEDEKNYFLPSERHFDFYYNLSKFNGIDKETVEGKIYFNINFSNYDKAIDFLAKKNNFSFFDCLNDSYFQISKKNKKQLFKKYIFNGYEYLFGINNMQEHEKIDMMNNFKREFMMNEAFLRNAINNYYIIPYLTVLFYRDRKQAFTNFLLLLFKNLKEIEKKMQKEVFDELFTYIRSSDIDFKEKIYISSLIVIINGGDERLTEYMMEILLEDEKYIEYHYEVVANIMFYSSNENIVKHDDYYLDLRNEIGKIANWISKDKKLEALDCPSKKSNNKKIAFIVDQLMSIHHSPTKLMLDYARNIKKYYPDYEVKIFVEDNLYCKNEIGIIPYLYTSAISSSIKDEHYKYLDNESIEVYYANVNLSKKKRTINLVNKVSEFNPDVILTNSDISVVSRMFYKTYPIVFMSMGGDYFSNLADAYLCGTIERIIKNNNRYGFLNEEKIYKFRYGLEFMEPKKDIRRSDYSIKQNDFVMVTVGNRLDAEMDEEFIDYIAKFIMKNDDVRWLIVGPRHINYIQIKYSFLFNDKIIRIQYEEDLPALYRICNVYLNPRRQGGGISIAMAMNEGLPIAVFKDKSDGAAFVEQDNCSGVSIQEYIDDLEMLRSNEEYREYKGNIMRENTKKLIYTKSIESLIKIIMQIK